MGWDSQPFPFLALPYELRHLIYEAMVPCKCLSHGNHNNTCHIDICRPHNCVPVSPCIIFTCRQISKESPSVIWPKHNHFSLLQCAQNVCSSFDRHRHAYADCYSDGLISSYTFESLFRRISLNHFRTLQYLTIPYSAPRQSE